MHFNDVYLRSVCTVCMYVLKGFLIENVAGYIREYDSIYSLSKDGPKKNGCRIQCITG